MTCNFTLGKNPSDEKISPQELYNFRRQIGECADKVSCISVMNVSAEEVCNTLTEVYKEVDLLLLWLNIQINYEKIKGAL
jgi:hypothetical protein